MPSDSDDGTKRVTFRADQSKIDRLDRLVHKAKGEGLLDMDKSRSDLLRRSIDDLIDELEDELGEEGEEGNPKAVPMTAD